MTQREKDLAVLRESIALLDRRLFREAEKRLPLFAELATLALDTPAEEEAALPATILRRTAQELLPAAEMGTPREAHRTPLRALRETLDACGRVAYINAYLALSAEKGQALSLFDLLPISQPGGARIAYVRNAYTDEAYESFAATLPSPTVRYADSFREACEEVVAGDADLCILPYRNSSGPLASFAELAERYSLYVCALCRVFHADGTDVTHFALYSRHLPKPADEAGIRLRFSFLCASTEMLARHISAGAMLGIALQELTAVPYAASEGSLLCTATALPQEGQLLPWLAYLSVFADGFACQGLYKEI